VDFLENVSEFGKTPMLMNRLEELECNCNKIILRRQEKGEFLA
jgi:hypothetical protein